MSKLNVPDVSALSVFELELERNGAGRAPNGASYKMLMHYGTMPAVQREIPVGGGQARREIIVGFNGAEFPSIEAARLWAVSDGRHETAPEGTMLNERRLIA